MDSRIALGKIIGLAIDQIETNYRENNTISDDDVMGKIEDIVLKWNAEKYWDMKNGIQTVSKDT